MSEFGELVAPVSELLTHRGVMLAGAFCVVGGVGMLWHQMRLRAEALRRGLRIREEEGAYAQLDARLPEDGDVRVLGKRVCRVVVEKSAFRRAAMLARDADGKLFVVGSAGVDDVTVEALNDWGGQVVAVRSGSEPLAGQIGVPVGTKSFATTLEPVDELAGLLLEQVRWMAMVAPLWTTGGRMVGALVICTQGVGSEEQCPGLDEMARLETLAVKLARTMENAALADRLLRSEKLASLGQLAGGVAHALNNPLTAVLGFAELIAETTEETRVQEDAETIVREALRMRETVQSLLDFWRPATLVEEPVNVGELLRKLGADCEDKLARRGVRMVVAAAEDEHNCNCISFGRWLLDKAK